jgi:choline dehydrogenase
VEAGPDYPDFDTAPYDIRDNSALGFLEHDWGFVARAGDAEVPLLRGRVVGGSSAVNATNALRPLESDFDRWVTLGLEEWGWDDCLKAFIELESDGAPGPWHGSNGRVPIRRYETSELQPFQGAFVHAALRAGHQWVSDLNGPGAIGVGPTPMNRDRNTRMTAARTHLDARVRARPNLRIRPGAEVDRLHVQRGRVHAVSLVGGEMIEGDVFVLCAGSVGSPLILLRSGIGDSDLSAVGVEQVADAAGVGRHLREHPAAMVVFEADSAEMRGMFPVAQTMLTASSGLSDDALIDLHVIPLTIAPDQFALMVSPVRPLATGSVTLRSASVEAHPSIDLALFGHEHDLAVGLRGIEIARSLARDAAFDGLLGAELAPGVGDDHVALTRAIREAPSLYYHACGTCSMGPADSPDAVVDPFGRVRSVEGLWVIDASIFPDIPSTPTNLATMMVASRCAGALSDLI